jgi:hypothetical protein
MMYYVFIGAVSVLVIWALIDVFRQTGRIEDDNN